VPSPPDRARRLCIIGDSHLASVRQALDTGLIRLPGWEVEFWGAAGAAFREIRMVDGAICAQGLAVPMVRQVNGRDRTGIRPGDFDCYLFYGARLSVHHFLGPFLQRSLGEGVQDSGAALRAAAAAWLIETRAYRFARDFAKAGAEVYFAPESLPTEGAKEYRIRRRVLHENPAAARAGPADRDRLWHALEEAAAAQGVTLLRQPEDTVTGGIFTAARWGLPDAARTQDAAHKTPAFAARMLQLFLAGACADSTAAAS